MSPGETKQPLTIDELRDRVKSLEKQLEKAVAENERLRKELEEALRALKRQAAPFSRRKPKKNPKKPGRRGGGEYGKQASRPVPDRVDEKIAVPLPKHCQCGGQTRIRRDAAAVPGRDRAENDRPEYCCFQRIAVVDPSTLLM